ncbi:MOSC domain-containing protein [Agromyces protaetiae]|uniref:MOSC domain-containing protein n=1 Tax=Agromyces protaetiae TaxID=2509455 RepID=A0A4P6F841_9MICO|nr:MOSC N-terminal beta barrel domain-containing protein [Agromyces protaetiae]QAY72260.1 MOSC domain-containing protein [Agromyces protaetiae]
MKLTRIRVHPVKSFAGVDTDATHVLPWGLEGDRRWAVVDPDGKPVTAREENAMLGLTAEVVDAGAGAGAGASALLLGSRDGAPALRVAMPASDAEPIAVGHSRQGTALPAGSDADAWLSARLGRPLRLVWQPDPRARTVNPSNGGRPGDILSLADAGPLLLASEASVARLNALALEDALERGETDAPPLVVERFRPNLVIDGDPREPFAEEAWSHVHVGGVRFRVQGVCDRCVMTTIDPDTLQRGKEPIRTLAKHRRREGKTWFGVWLVPDLDASETDVLSVGDEVQAA